MEFRRRGGGIHLKEAVSPRKRALPVKEYSEVDMDSLGVGKMLVSEVVAGDSSGRGIKIRPAKGRRPRRPPLPLPLLLRLRTTSLRYSRTEVAVEMA